MKNLDQTQTVDAATLAEALGVLEAADKFPAVPPAPDEMAAADALLREIVLDSNWSSTSEQIEAAQDTVLSEAIDVAQFGPLFAELDQVRAEREQLFAEVDQLIADREQLAKEVTEANGLIRDTLDPPDEDGAAQDADDSILSAAYLASVDPIAANWFYQIANTENVFEQWLMTAALPPDMAFRAPDGTVLRADKVALSLNPRSNLVGGVPV